jgi:hypothetical protein
MSDQQIVLDIAGDFGNIGVVVVKVPRLMLASRQISLTVIE